MSGKRQQNQAVNKSLPQPLVNKWQLHLEKKEKGSLTRFLKNKFKLHRYGRQSDCQPAAPHPTSAKQRVLALMFRMQEECHPRPM